MPDETPPPPSPDGAPPSPDEVKAFKKQHEEFAAKQLKKFKEQHYGMVANSVDQLATQLFIESFRKGLVFLEDGKTGKAMEIANGCFHLACTYYETVSHHGTEQKARLEHLTELNLKTMTEGPASTEVDQKSLTKGDPPA